MTNGIFGGCFGHFNMYHHLKPFSGLSDHTLLYFSLECNTAVPDDHERSEIKFKWSNAKWGQFRSGIICCLPKFNSIVEYGTPKLSGVFDVYEVEFRTFVFTRILTGPDIRAHIKWPPRTFVLTSNDHPGHSCSHQMTTPDIRAHYPLLLMSLKCHFIYVFPCAKNKHLCR